MQLGTRAVLLNNCSDSKTQFYEPKSSYQLCLDWQHTNSSSNNNHLKMKVKKARRRRSADKLYTAGELNKLIDSLCHPLSKTDKGFMLVDGFLHGLVEQNPPATIRKFMKYNLPKIIKQLEKEAAQKESLQGDAICS